MKYRKRKETNDKQYQSKYIIMARGKNHHTSMKRRKRVFKRDKWNIFEKGRAFQLRKKGLPVASSSEGDPVLAKRRKLNSEAESKLQNYSDTSEEENIDPYKELLLSFTVNGQQRQKRAIESSSESSEDDANSGSENAELSKSRDLTGIDEEKITNKNNSNEDDSDSASEAAEEEEEEINSSLDPFIRHLQFDLDDNLLQAISSNPGSTIRTECTWPILGRLIVHIPKLGKAEVAKQPSKAILEDDKYYAEPGTIPQQINSSNLDSLHIKTQIQPTITKANFKNLTETSGMNTDVPLTPLQKELFSVINNYQDIYYPERTLKNGEEIRLIYCLHAINHVLKTRTKILHHNQKLQNKSMPEEYRDQGLVRPKVLIVVPFKDSALRVVKMLIEILIPDEKANIMNKKRFFDEFSGNELAMPKKNPRPEDYEATFAGNVDDTFRIGISVTKKSLKLYADFYSADIIVASPLGLRVIVGAEGEEGRDFDFLASIELLILDQAEIFIMQNWDHLLHVLDHFHLQPQESHGTDFSRVRTWALNGWTRFYRQTLLFSSVFLPDLNALFNKRCHNYAGKIQVVNPILSGSICEVVVPLPQVFHRFEGHSSTHAIDARFEFFLKTFTQFKDTLMKHVLIYIPSYFDYVRVRNYFKHEDLKFVQICEYSKEGKIARARDMFFHGDAYFLLYSERFHFFRRPRIKGIRHLIFYQPPTFPHFYSEMCNLMQEANQNKAFGNESNMTVTVLYTKYDVQRLAAIVGTDRVTRMVNSERNVHMFMTGE